MAATCNSLGKRAFRALLVLAILVIVAVAILWFARQPILDMVIAGNVERLGLQEFELKLDTVSRDRTSFKQVRLAKADPDLLFFLRARHGGSL